MTSHLVSSLAASMLLVSTQLAGAAPTACPIPDAVAPAGKDELAAKFGASTAAFRNTAANIRDGFQRACVKGLRIASTFPDIRGGDTRRIHFENWPDANEFVIEADQRSNGTWRLMLSGPFAATSGEINLPSPAAVEEAIACAVGAVSEKEQAESGRCLVD